MHILKLSYEYPPLGGGGSRVVQGLIRELTRLGHRVDLVTMGFRGLPDFETGDRFNIRRVPCLRSQTSVCHSYEMLTYIVMALPRILREVRNRRYDILHAHFIYPDGVLAYLVYKRTGLPYIITAHGSDVPGYNPDRFRGLHKILYPFWKKITRASEKVICPSRTLEVLVKEASSRVSTSIIPNGFDTDRFLPNREKKDRILIVTRMFERKGVQYFLKAVDGLDVKHEIHIVGDGPFLEDLKRLASSISAEVTFWGYLDNYSDDLKELFETSKIFVFPSESENFPIVLLEAMAAGAAVITTTGTGCAEVVGDTALLVKPKDPDGLRGALLKYVNNPALCAQSGEMARKRLDDNFSWNTVAKQYVAEYEKYRTASLKR